MADNIKETAKQEISATAKQASDAAKSGAYLYPLQGIFYFWTHKSLWKPFLSRLVPTMGLGAAVTTAMFFFTYLPQLGVLFFTSGPLAVASTVVLVLSESSTLTMVLAKTLLIEDALIDTFDGTLVAKGHTGLVEQQRQVKGSSFGDSVQRLGKLATKPFQKFTPAALARYLISLPLNFIPVVGTVMFVLLQARNRGPATHARYFQLKGMNAAQKERYVEARKGSYTAFGVPAVLLEMVPLAGILFAFTNTCGAALMAADFEQHGDTSPELRDKASSSKKAA
ncbi:Outer spore wall protein [Sphaerulina musiva]